MNNAKEFEKWLSTKGLSEVTVYNYMRMIRYLKENDYGILSNGQTVDIFSMDNVYELQTILNNENFIIQNRKANNAYSASINHYIKFLNEVSGSDAKMAYSSETGNVNVDILQSSLNVTRKGAEVVFQNEELFIISPSIQNGSDWFDIRKVNLIRFQESGKKGLLILRHGENFLIADLNNFAQQMMQDETIKSTFTGGEHWKFNIISSGDIQAVFNQGNRNILFIFRFATIGNLEKETVKLIKSIKVYSPIIKELDEKNQYGKRHDVNLMTSKDLIPHIHQYIISKGFNYSLENIKNLYLSLRSKPFVIISGISGTGKTKIVQLFAESLDATEENRQFKLIPVRPDWSDGSELLGYKDITGNIVEGQLTKMVREASMEENRDRPYFLLLDEMNLARVEYYFSDVLSIMESRKKVNGISTSAQLVPDIDPLLTLPNNLYIIGTVNMDETTHPFSKKVLDRANTIEFNEINLNHFGYLEQTEEVEAVTCSNQSLEASLLNLKDCYDDHKDLIERVSKQLAKMNEILQEVNAQVGYRVRDEICFYMIHNAEGKLLEEQEALDFCYMQKILPRISGADSVDKVLEKLHELFSENHPMSAKKAQEMLDRLRRDSFTSFWTS